ncbi:MAG: shikimate dehydrogenase [Thermomicrobiales bacterium]
MSSTAITRLQVRLLGYPVGHSLSPLMHGAAFAALGIDADYAVWETLPAQLADRVGALRGAEFLGANVTIPHKEQVLALLDEVSPLALRAGAVNTIVKRGTILHGENTDIGGFLWPLRAGGAALDRWRVTLLGAGRGARRRGGAARRGRAAPDDRQPHGHPSSRPGERARRRARRSAATRRRLGRRRAGPVRPRRQRHRRRLAAGRPAHPRCRTDRAPARPRHRLRPHLSPHTLLRVAEARGLATIDGLPMLVEQGALAFQFWTGREAPRPAMWAAAQAGRA